MNHRQLFTEDPTCVPKYWQGLWPRFAFINSVSISHFSSTSCACLKNMMFSWTQLPDHGLSAVVYELFVLFPMCWANGNVSNVYLICADKHAGIFTCFSFFVVFGKGVVSFMTLLKTWRRTSIPWCDVCPPLFSFSFFLFSSSWDGCIWPQLSTPSPHPSPPPPLHSSLPHPRTTSSSIFACWCNRFASS